MTGDPTQDKSKRPITLNRALNWNRWALTEQAKSLRFVSDGEGNLWATPIVLTGTDKAGNNEVNMAYIGKIEETQPWGDSGLVTKSVQLLYNHVGEWLEPLRTPLIFKTAYGTANFDVWEPAAGHRFRLMGGVVTVAAPTLAAAAVNRLLLVDGATSTGIGFSVWCAAAVAATTIVIPFTLPGNGYLSILADNHLSMTFGASFTAGQVECAVWGCEELG